MKIVGAFFTLHSLKMRMQISTKYQLIFILKCVKNTCCCSQFIYFSPTEAEVKLLEQDEHYYYY